MMISLPSLIKIPKICIRLIVFDHVVSSTCQSIVIHDLSETRISNKFVFVEIFVFIPR